MTRSPSKNTSRPNPALEAELRSRGKDKYADKVAHAGDLNVSYVYQDEPLGLGHAVHCAADRVEGEPFFVLLGDVLVPDNQMLIKMKEVSDAHNGASVIAVLPVAKEEVDRFGVIAGEALSDDVWKVIFSRRKAGSRGGSLQFGCVWPLSSFAACYGVAGRG